MVQVCIVCKKEQNPLTKNCSFHRFPSHPELKQKWLNIIGLSSVSASTSICSDHFSSNSFHSTGGIYGYIIKKRLLSTAVPSIENLRSGKSSVHINNDSTCSTKELDEEESFDEKPIDLVNVSEPSHIPDDNPSSNDCETDSNVQNRNNNCKRPCLLNDVLLKKKIRFTTGYKTECLSREDFVSDEAWIRFMRFTTYKKRQLNASHSRFSRKRKSVNNLNDVIRKLKD